MKDVVQQQPQPSHQLRPPAEGNAEKRALNKKKQRGEGDVEEEGEEKGTASVETVIDGRRIKVFDDTHFERVREKFGGDHKCLLDMTYSLCKRIMDEQSFLVRFYLHFCDVSSGRFYVAMNNVFHIKALKGKAVWKYIFDLKGSRDDKLITEDGKRIHEVHRRWYACYNCWYCCDCCCTASCIPEERTKYYAGKKFAFDGKLHMTRKQKNLFTETLKRDVSYLRKNQVMDYSLLVGVQTFETLEDAKKAGALSTKYVCNVTEDSSGEKLIYVYYMGIVDFFQKWNCAKTVANLLKSCCAPHPLSTVRPDKYAKQFETHLLEKFTNKASKINEDLDVERVPHQSSLGCAEMKSEMKGDNNASAAQSIRGSISRDAHGTGIHSGTTRSSKPLNPQSPNPDTPGSQNSGMTFCCTRANISWGGCSEEERMYAIVRLKVLGSGGSEHVRLGERKISSVRCTQHETYLIVEHSRALYWPGPTTKNVTACARY